MGGVIGREQEVEEEASFSPTGGLRSFLRVRISSAAVAVVVGRSFHP